MEIKLEMSDEQLSNLLDLFTEIEQTPNKYDGFTDTVGQVFGQLLEYDSIRSEKSWGKE